MTRAAELDTRLRADDELFVEHLRDLIAVRLALAGVGGGG